MKKSEPPMVAREVFVVDLEVQLGSQVSITFRNSSRRLPQYKFYFYRNFM